MIAFVLIQTFVILYAIIIVMMSLTFIYLFVTLPMLMLNFDCMR